MKDGSLKEQNIEGREEECFFEEWIKKWEKENSKKDQIIF